VASRLEKRQVSSTSLKARVLCITNRFVCMYIDIFWHNRPDALLFYKNEKLAPEIYASFTDVNYQKCCFQNLADELDVTFITVGCISLSRLCLPQKLR